MRKIFYTSAVVLFIGIRILPAQETTLKPEFKSSAIDKMVELINDNYVFPDVAKKTGEHLKSRLNEGYFNAYNDLDAFAKALTQEVQSVNHDKHMRVRSGGPPARSGPGADGTGFKESKILEGNIGYIDMRQFAPAMVGAAAADEHMKALADADAIIIDLRKNGGGSPDMVQYLCSYFFNKKVHLNSLYYRVTDRTTEFWTKDVNGKKMPDVPLFILTSKFTFSAAEEFTYNMQTQKRATLVGETTGGGANPGGLFTINDQMSMFIPTGRAINPITGTNWEGVGVVPEVKTSSDEALDKAIELARKAAGEFKKKKS